MPQINRFNEEKQSLCMRIVNFWYISLPSSAKQREMTKFKVLWRASAYNSKFFILFLNSDATPTIWFLVSSPFFHKMSELK